MIPTTRQELIQHCLRRLGAPVIEINVDEDQIEDRVDEALQFFQEYHSDAVHKVYERHEITQEDRDNRWIPIDPGMLSVQAVLPFDGVMHSMGVGMWSPKYQMFLNGMGNMAFTGQLANYFQTMQYMETMSLVMDGQAPIRFNRHMDNLYIFGDWEHSLEIGKYIIVEGYRIIDPEEYGDVYNDMFLKRYLTALIKKQWGTNLKKFEGMILPGGVALNGQQMYQESTEELKQIELEMQLKYEFPPSFITG